MCQMCDEYENELRRMGLIADAVTFREERQAEEAREKAGAPSRDKAAATQVDERRD